MQTSCLHAYGFNKNYSLNKTFKTLRWLRLTRSCRQRKPTQSQIDQFQMPGSVVCALNTLTRQTSKQSAQAIQQQQLQLRQQLQQQQSIGNAPAVQFMLIEDEVHGVIGLPDHIKEIVNHPLFQRLKKIYQLGFVSFASHPLATHKRFEHCIGTYKSAQDQLNALKRNSNYEPQLPGWCRDSVEIAALLHDVGHGPFSHSWEQVCGDSFDHERNGLACVDKIFAEVQSKELLSLRDDNNGRGIQLIKALILGKSELLTYPMMGHGYIFDIVHNRRCGVDVDKWDYLRRDNKRLKLLTEEEMDFNDVFLKARISPDGQRIEYRYEDYHLIYKMFVARWRLNVGAYLLPQNLALDNILAKIVQRCQPHLLDLRADSNDWTGLNDETVLRLIESDPLTAYVFAPERWLRTTSCNGQNADCVCVNCEKLGPGVDMKPDESYALYGDKSKKRSIDRQLRPTPIIACFKLL